MSLLGAVQIDLRSRSSLGSSSNLSGIGQSWPPGKWHPTPPYIVFLRSFGPQRYCISCACLILRHPSSSDFGGWPHQYSFFWGRSSLHLFLGAWWPKTDGEMIYLKIIISMSPYAKIRGRKISTNQTCTRYTISLWAKQMNNYKIRRNRTPPSRQSRLTKTQ